MKSQYMSISEDGKLESEMVSYERQKKVHQPPKAKVQ